MSRPSLGGIIATPGTYCLGRVGPAFETGHRVGTGCAYREAMFAKGTGGVSIGRLWGIELRVHWSLLVIFALILLSLATGVFPSWHPDWSPGLGWVVAGAATLLFFASVVAHEMGHALVARHYGIPVHSITLFLFGGIASLEDDPDSPKKEALMAGIGPLISIGLGVGFLVLASLIVSVPAEADPELVARQMSPLATLLAWLGPINIIIGLFNMLPGFPLDGGRVLRAILWGVTGDLVRATRWATLAGQALGALLMLGGVMMALGYDIPFFGAGFGPGLWLLLIGWFLYGAAAASQNRLLAKQALAGLKVEAVMRSRLPEAIPADCSIESWVGEHVLTTGAEQFLVRDEHGHVVGIAQVTAARTVPQELWPTTPVSAVMEPLDASRALAVDEDALAAVKKLETTRARELYVLRDGELVGLFGLRDVLRYLELRAPHRPHGPMGKPYAAADRQPTSNRP